MQGKQYNITPNTLVSVIVPVYNVEKVLTRCIESILMQSYSCFELILINDGSMDGSGKICDEYAAKDSRIRVFHTPNSGAAHARNVGLEHCTGEWVSFIDADDFVKVDYLKVLLSMVMEYHVDYAFCGALYFKEDKTEAEFEDYSFLPVLINKSEWNYVDGISHFNIWATMIKRNCIGNIRFCEDLYMGEDTYFTACIVCKCEKILYIPQSLYCYVVYQNSTMHGPFNHQRSTEVDGWILIYDIMKDIGRIQRLSSATHLAEVAKKCFINCKLSQEIFNQEFEKKMIHIMRSHWKEYMLNHRHLKSKIMFSLLCFFPRTYRKLWLSIHNGQI